MRVLSFVALVATVLASTSAAQASFIDVDPDWVIGDSVNLDNGSDLTSTTGNVAATTVLIESDGTELFSAASGNATIKPEKDNLLTELTFTLADGLAFSAFKFNAQMLVDAFTLTWEDNDGNTGVINYTGLPLNANRSYAIGAFDGETLKSVTLSAAGDGFKELKQFEFGVAVPEPSSLALLGMGAFAGLVIRKRKRAADQV